MTCHCCCCCCCVYGVVLDFLWDIISYVIYVYIVNYMWSDSLYMSLCNVILFVGWFLFGRANNNHPSPSPIHPLLFGLYSSFSHRDKNGYDFWTISEASLTPIYTIAFISRSIFFAPCSTYKLPLQTKPSSFQIIIR
jgi:hypothetical protein